MTGEAINYRLADLAADRPALRRLFVDEHELSSYAEDVLDSPDLVAWVAHAGQEIVAAILTRPMRSDDGVELGGIDELLVARRYQGQKIGRRLVEFAEAHYLAAGAAGMQLTVTEDNARALRLYESMGYAVAQSRLRMRKQFGER
jgi:ribosomal protein S18 acetylase RimI-like enzyme